MMGDEVGVGLGGLTRRPQRRLCVLREMGGLGEIRVGEEQDSKVFVCFSLNADLVKTCTLKVEGGR